MEQFDQHILPLKDKMFRFALRMMHNAEDAEDVVQEVLIKIWTNRERLASITNLEAWSIQLVKHQAIDRLRMLKRHIENLDSHYEIKDQEMTPEQKTTGNNLMEILNRLMESLPEKQKLVIQLRDIEGMAYQEIAEILEIPLNQVKINLFRARNILKQQIEQLKLYERAKHDKISD